MKSLELSSKTMVWVAWTPVVAVFAVVAWVVTGPTGSAMCAVTFYLGAVASSGRIRLRSGRLVTVPIVERSRAATMGLVLLMVTLSLSTITQFQITTDRQTRCNVRVRDALNFNQQLNDRLRPITTEQEAQLEIRRAAIDKLVNDLIAGQQPLSVQEAQQSLRTYQATVAAVNQRRDELAKERADIVAKRSTYPDPDCGE